MGLGNFCIIFIAMKYFTKVKRIYVNRFNDYFIRIEVKIMIDFPLIYFAVGKLNLRKKDNILLILEIGENWGAFEEKVALLHAKQ